MGTMFGKMLEYKVAGGNYISKTEDIMRTKGTRSFFALGKPATFLLIAASLVFGCAGEKAGARKAVQDLLLAAYEKNYAKVRQVVDFDGIVDNSLRGENSGNLEPGQREKIIDEMVKSTCEISKGDLDMALSSLRVETERKNPNYAIAMYNTSKRTNITLTLEKRKTGWIVTGIG